MSAVIFTNNDIIGMSSSIPLSVDKDNVFEDIIKSLKIGNFKTTKTYTSDFGNSLDEMIPRITFTGKGFSFGLLKTKFASQFLYPSQFVSSGSDQRIEREDPSKLFATENLDQLSSDFNYVLGLIFGRLDLDDKNYKLRFNIQVSKEISIGDDLSRMLKPDSKTIFGNVTAFRLNGININMNENLFNTQVQSQYDFYVKKNKKSNDVLCTINSKFRFKHSGPVDFSKLVHDSIKRLNSLTMNIGGNLNEPTI